MSSNMYKPQLYRVKRLELYRPLEVLVLSVSNVGLRVGDGTK